MPFKDYTMEELIYLNKAYVGIIGVVLFIFIGLFFFKEQEPTPVEMQKSDETELQELRKRNERLTYTVSLLKKKNEELSALSNSEIAKAVVVLEKYLLSEDIEEAKPFFSDIVSFPADEEPDHPYNPNHINFPTSMYEWRSNKHERLEFYNFSKETDGVSLFYKASVYDYENIYEFKMVEEDGWKIKDIRSVK